jgi:hypothetical protein
MHTSCYIGRFHTACNPALAVCCILAFAALSCDFSLQYEKGNGNIVTRKVPVASFKGIIIGGNYNVLLREDTDHAVEITTDENLMDAIEIGDHDGLLYIGNVKKLKGTEGIEVVVYYTMLHRIESTGSSSVRTSGSIDGDVFVLDQSGSAAFTGSFNTRKLEINMSGAGVVKAMGYTETQEITISGAGGYQGFDLHSKNCDITLSGIGGASIYVTDTLEATITGIGGILYRGQPAHIRRRITGVGKIRPDTGNDA